MPADMAGIVSPFFRAAFDNERGLFYELAAAFGGPLHYLDPSAMRSNIDAFQAVAARHALPLSIAFAKKANKALAFADTAREAGISLDVASLAELEQGLSRGFSGTRLSVSGGTKPLALLERAVACDATIVCDSEQELATLSSLFRGTKVRVLLRFRPASQKASRFGLPESELARIGESIDRTRIDLAGLAFHCAGYDPLERITAALASLEPIQALRAQGHNLRVLDIGGGFSVRYRANEAVATEFHADHAVHATYPYAGTDGPTMLDTILQRIAQPLRDARLTLMIEPGRALLDQAGVTMTQVLGVGELITVDAMSFSLSEQWFGSDFFVDPVLIPKEPRTSGVSWAGAIAGASCLESDMLAWRKVRFNVKPQVGDLLCFVNTAGYQMDSNESEFHGTPLPKKIILHPVGARWCLDGIRPEVSL